MSLLAVVVTAAATVVVAEVRVPGVTILFRIPALEGIIIPVMVTTTRTNHGSVGCLCACSCEKFRVGT